MNRLVLATTATEVPAEETVDFLGIEVPHVIPNGVEQRFFDAAPASRGQLQSLGLNTPYVLYAGGSSRRKNLDVLPAAWAIVTGSGPDLHLVLAGPTNAARQALFRDAGNVHDTGRLPDEAMPGLVAAAATVVVTSHYEGFGLPALEAMPAAPIVAACTSSLPEVIADGGILVEPTAAGLAEGLLWATSGEADVAKVAMRGRARADAFTWDRSAAGHAAIWSQVWGTRG